MDLDSLASIESVPPETETLAYGGHLFIRIVNASKIQGLHKKMFMKESTSNLFVRVWAGPTLLAQSPVVQNTCNPQWDWGTCVVLKPVHSTEITMEVVDDPVTVLGETRFNLSDISVVGVTEVFNNCPLEKPRRAVLQATTKFVRTMATKGGKRSRGKLSFSVNYFRNKYDARSAHRMPNDSEMRIMHTGKKYYVRHGSNFASFRRPVVTDDDKMVTLSQTNNLPVSPRVNVTNMDVNAFTSNADVAIAVDPCAPPSSSKPSKRGGRFLRGSLLHFEAPRAPNSPGSSIGTTRQRKEDIPPELKIADDIPWPSLTGKIDLIRVACSAGPLGVRYHKPALRGILSLWNSVMAKIGPVMITHTGINGPPDQVSKHLFQALKLRLSICLNETSTLLDSFRTRASLALVFRGGSPIGALLGLEKELNAIASHLMYIVHATTSSAIPVKGAFETHTEDIQKALTLYEAVRLRIREHGGSRELLALFVQEPWHLNELANMLEILPMDLQDELDLWLIEQQQHDQLQEKILGNLFKKFNSRRNADALDSNRMMELILRERNRKAAHDVESSGESASDTDGEDDISDDDNGDNENNSAQLQVMPPPLKPVSPRLATDRSVASSASHASVDTSSNPLSPRFYRNDHKIWYAYFGKADCVSVDYFVNVLDIVYNESRGFDAPTFSAIAEVLDSYPYTGAITYGDWASLHRMMRLSGMLPREFLRQMAESMTKDDVHIVARERCYGAPSRLRVVEAVPEIPIMSRVLDVTISSEGDGLGGYKRYYGSAISMHLPLREAQTSRYFRAVMGVDHTALMRATPNQGMRRQSIFQQSKSTVGAGPIKRKRCLSFIVPNAMTGGPIYPVPLYSTTIME